jgi:hypothetical protein
MEPEIGEESKFGEKSEKAFRFAGGFFGVDSRAG